VCLSVMAMVAPEDAHLIGECENVQVYIHIYTYILYT